MRGLRSLLTSVLVIAFLATSLPVAAQTTVSYVGGEVEGGGTVTGKVTWTGPEPKLEPFVINKNVEVCDAGGNGTRPSSRLRIAKSGGVANAVVYIEEILQGKPFDTAGASLGQKNCRYEPHIVILPRKAELTMSSSDAILHNIHMFDAAHYNIPFPNEDTVAKRMRKSGVVRVQCDAGHGWMSAYVFVVSHPYYALTDENGAFTFSDVPPGKYTVKMWHEHWEVINKIEKDGVVTGYDFEDPIEQAKEIDVSSGGKTEVGFVLSQ